MKQLSTSTVQMLFPFRTGNNIYYGKNLLLLIILMLINSALFSQFYAGNNFTNKGVSITPGYLFTNNEFIEAEANINATDDFVFSKYSFLGGKQFLFTGNNGDEDRCLKIRTSIGATLSKYKNSFMDVTYKQESDSYKLYENTSRITRVNMNYRVEVVWHNKPFDYFILAGYNNGMYSGVGWRGYLKKK